MSSAKIVLPRGQASKPDAVIGRFTNGRLADDSGIKFGIFESTKPTKTKEPTKRKLVAETSRMQYLGTNYSTDAPTSPYRNMVGVFDKNLGVCQLYDAEVFTLSPHWPEKEGKDETDKKTLTFMQKADLLTSAFGSNKKRRAMVSRQKNQIKEEALVTAVGNAVEDAISQSNQDRPFINDKEMLALATPTQVFMECTSADITKWITEEMYYSYVLSKLNILPQEKPARTEKACQLMYLQYLIHMYRLRSRDLCKKDFLHVEMPTLIKKSLLEKFTLLIDSKTHKVRCIPARLKDKLLLHILVLCLIIDEYNFEFTPVMRDLKTGQQKIMTHLKTLGCKIEVQKVPALPGSRPVQVRIATLPVPLVLPCIKGSRQRKAVR